MAKKAATDDTMTDEASATTDSVANGGGEGSLPVPRKDRPKKKTVMVDNAIQAMGRQATPLEIQRWIKDHYDLLLKPTLLSTYKTNWLRKNGKGGGRKPGRPKGSKNAAAPAAAKAGGGTGGSDATLSDVRTLKELLGRVGTRQLKEMLSLLGVQ